MWQRLYTRARQLDELKADAALAALFALSGAVESMFVHTGGHSRALTALSAVTLAVPLAWRRRDTLASILGCGAVLAATAPLNTFLISNLTTPFALILVLPYTVGRHENGRRMWVEVILVVVIVAAVGGIAGPTDVLWTAVFTGAPFLAGRALRSRILFQREMREKARRLESERELRAWRAVEEERARIASELQAVVANGVSAMVVQAEAVPRLFAADDRSAAVSALAVIEDTGRDALAEMRRLLGVLRRDHEGPALAPQPSLTRAGSLLARVQADGLPAAMTVEGEPAALSPGVDLAGYRVLQEALSSAMRAPGVSRAEVSIAYGDDNVLVRVRDDRQGPDAAGPDILRALRERVGLYGGLLRAASGANGGFELEARLPIEGPR